MLVVMMKKSEVGFIKNYDISDVPSNCQDGRGEGEGGGEGVRDAPAPPYWRPWVRRCSGLTRDLARRGRAAAAGSRQSWQGE